MKTIIKKADYTGGDLPEHERANDRLPRQPQHEDGDVVVTPITKEGQRAELHKTIWRIANDLRGSVDGWDFKSYVLGMLFYRFISENLTAYLNEQERAAGQPDFDYAALGDADAEFGREETVKEKGFYILPKELFANVRKRADKDENLNETLEKVFKTSKVPLSAQTAKTTSKACSTISMSTAPSSATPSPSATKSW